MTIEKQLEKLAIITHGRIPVSEESPVFGLFLERRKLAIKIKDKEYSEESLQYVFLTLEDVENKIKEYLCL